MAIPAVIEEVIGPVSDRIIRRHMDHLRPRVESESNMQPNQSSLEEEHSYWSTTHFVKLADYNVSNGSDITSRDPNVSSNRENDKSSETE